tara:strand:+ start:523 stop:792 length:270 start_codon:yes stop_codon:yes gene_type:complete
MILSIIYILLLVFVFVVVLSVFAENANGEPPAANSKFYDFSEQVIDGQIKKPTALYTDSKQKVKFDRLLKLKKSFLPAMLKTAKDPVFK